MRIITWNLFFQNKRQRKGIEHILSLQPDVITLQEVSGETVMWLQQHSGYIVNASFDWKNRIKEKKNAYVCTLTKRKPVAVDAHVYDHQKPRSILASVFYNAFLHNLEQHTVIVVTVTSPNGRIQIANTRLSCAVGTQDRLEEFQNMVNKTKHKTVPTIYCGDFNVVDSPLFNRVTGWLRGFDKHDYRINEREAFERLYIKERLHNIFRGKPTTFVNKPILQFDHILVPAQFTVSYSHILRKHFGSDHRILIADVDI